MTESKDLEGKAVCLNSAEAETAQECHKEQRQSKVMLFKQNTKQLEGVLKSRTIEDTESQYSGSSCLL